MSTFTLLPVVKVEDERLMYVYPITPIFVFDEVTQPNFLHTHKSPPKGDKYL